MPQALEAVKGMIKACYIVDYLTDPGYDIQITIVYQHYINTTCVSTDSTLPAYIISTPHQQM